MRFPYPGLRAFAREEADLFFGRERCVDDMIDCLSRSRFLAVLGSSGSGKSSLVRTGLLEGLEVGFLASAGSRWLFADMHPGGQPLRNLATRLLKAIPARSADQEDIEILRSFLKRGPKSIVEWCRVGNLPKGTNLLLLVDQFEELFRYTDYSQREEAEAFAALLLESAANVECPIYVVITMRSEFLGACALIPNLAEQINKSLYLTPRMTRSEVKEAIVGPSLTQGFHIEDALTTRLLNDLAAFAPWEAEPSPDQVLRLARRADQLPLMQHVLNRLWLRAKAANPATITLRLAEYDALGGLTGALDAHAREVLARIKHSERDVEAVFRCLIDGYDVASAVRRPCTFQKLVQETGKPKEMVREILDAFRAPDCNFLVPAQAQTLVDQTIIDIGHESLIRQWSLLSEWLGSESKSGANWQRLRLAATLHFANAGDLLRGLDLANLDAWWQEEQPSAAWAERYGGHFTEVSDFLEQSRDAEAKLYRERRRRQQRVRWIGFGVAAVVLFSVAGIAYVQQQIRLMAAQTEAAEFRDRERQRQLLTTKIEKAQLLFNEAAGLSQSQRRNAVLKFEEVYSELTDIDYRDQDIFDRLPFESYLDLTERAFNNVLAAALSDQALFSSAERERFEALAAREYNLTSFFLAGKPALQDRLIKAAVGRSMLYLDRSLAQGQVNPDTYALISREASQLCTASGKGEPGSASQEAKRSAAPAAARLCFSNALYPDTTRLKLAEASSDYEGLLKVAYLRALEFHNTSGALPSWELERLLGRLLVAQADLLLERRTETETKQAVDLLRQAQISFYSKDAALRLRDIYEKGAPGVPANGGSAAEARRAVARLDFKETKVPLRLGDGQGREEERDVTFFDPRFDGEDPVATVVNQLETYEGYVVPEDRKSFLNEIWEKAQQQGRPFTAMLNATFNEFGDVATATLVARGLATRLRENRQAIEFLRYAQSRTSANDQQLLYAFYDELKSDINQNPQRYLRLIELVANAGTLSGIGKPLALAVEAVGLRLPTGQLGRLNYHLGRIKEKGYDSGGAASSYAASFAVDPGETRVNALYALRFLDDPSKAALGKASAQRAFSRDENDPLARFAWGWAQFVEGARLQDVAAVQRALPFMETGLQATLRDGNKADEAELRHRLGQTYAFLGRRDVAQDQFEKALEATPTRETANAILKSKRALLEITAADRKALQDSAIRLAATGAFDHIISADRARIAIRGYDTVAYFTRGRPRLGLPRYYHVWAGAVWFFESPENRKRFAENPEQFAPAYGGFCAYCLAASKVKLHSTPEYWRIYRGRLYLHNSPASLSDWAKKPTTYLAVSDNIWSSLAFNAPNGEAQEISLTNGLANTVGEMTGSSKAVNDAFNKQNYAEAARLQVEWLAAVRRAETAGDDKPGEGTLKALLSLSWYQLFAGQYDAVIATANEASAIKEDYIVIDTILAHALMLKGEADLARSVYRKHEDKEVVSGKIWQSIILQDFNELERSNIKHPLMDEIRKAWAARS